MKAKPLLRYAQRNGHVELDPVSSSSNSSKPWMVVQDLPFRKNTLVKGDVVMLGRATLQVCQIVLDPEDATPPEILGEAVCACDETQDDTALQCRICLDSATMDDPFVSPCSCKGSIEKVHLGCLRHWTKTRLNLPRGEVDGFVFQKPVCEMCKADYPAYIQQGEMRQQLVDELPKVAPPYMVLQSSGKPSKSHNKEPRVSYHVISFADEKRVLKIGRGHECGLRLDEVSMSRWHASIKFSDGEFYVEDHNSKFGTLLALNRPWQLCADAPVSIKVGRTVLAFELPSLPQPHMSPIQPTTCRSMTPCKDQEDFAAHQELSKANFHQLDA